MVGRGAARLVSDQARILESWRCSSWANAVSKNLAWRCQAGSLVSGVSGESADGIMPARNFAVSSADAVWAQTGSAAANSITAASVAIRTEYSMFIHDPRIRPRGPDLPACGRRRKSGDLN